MHLQKERMIRNLCTCGAYSIRPYPYGRKDLFLRSILGLCEMVWHFFWSKKWSCKIDYPSIWIEKGSCEKVRPFFWYGKWLCRIDYTSIWIEKGSCKMAGKDFWNMFLKGVFEVLISEGIFSCHKMKALRICGKIRSAKQKESIWGCLFILAITHGRA